MEGRTKIAVTIIGVLFVALVVYTYMVPIIWLVLGDPYQVDLIEINSNLTDVENRTLTYLTEEDFKKSPELRELFKGVNPIGEEGFDGAETKFVNSISVGSNKAEEIRKEYSNKTLYWDGGYYGILIQIP
ncbi:hypothetical protein Mpet_1747 [Methanolacinia petrolearia DSM 11571]|uniref:Uncharacterized protein n=1 Tax=Methanolacinia petrolearia (strain DSM 11571 / OCM 486 / SEBR 4847) TaxID=679926 RepID=E1RHW2_METP4|nr:hypothetical protein [Methanolacinia petrolearia]ADN36500.1 hypothetical protein Mpet_1747 [Methanolacinia petrolearia DSM 11571]